MYKQSICIFVAGGFRYVQYEPVMSDCECEDNTFSPAERRGIVEDCVQLDTVPRDNNSFCICNYDRQDSTIWPCYKKRLVSLFVFWFSIESLGIFTNFQLKSHFYVFLKLYFRAWTEALCPDCNGRLNKLNFFCLFVICEYLHNSFPTTQISASVTFRRRPAPICFRVSVRRCFFVSYFLHNFTFKK
jgi:hypothetical protein